jgi:hypothetical protein
MGEFIKCHKTSVAWVVAVWMVTVLILLAIGPVWRP